MSDEWDIQDDHMYEVPGHLLRRLVDVVPGMLMQAELDELEELRRDVNGRQQFWVRQRELAAEPKRA